MLTAPENPDPEFSGSGLLWVLGQPWPLAAILLAALVVIGAIFADLQYDRAQARQVQAAFAQPSPG